MNAVDESIARACELVPNLVQCALVLLPEGYLIGGLGSASVTDHEPLIRSAARCLAVRPAPAVGDHPSAPFVEYLFVVEDEVVVIQGGRTDPRLALAVVCTREAALGFVLVATRHAIRALEASIDLAAWGV